MNNNSHKEEEKNSIQLKSNENNPIQSVEENSLQEDKVEILSRMNEHELRNLIISRYHSGPIPSPEDMRGYNGIIPNAAERILAMAEKEQNFRIELNQKKLNANIKLTQRSLCLKFLGQCFAFLTILLFFGLAAYLAYKEQYGLAVFAVGGIMASIVGIFVTGKKIDSKNSEKD